MSIAFATLVTVALAAAPLAGPNTARSIVEFRPVEAAHVRGVTEEKGIRTTCAETLSYLHAKPILSSKDFAAADIRPLLGGWSEVTFELSDAARKRLATDPSRDKELAILVDGRYKGTTYYRPTGNGPALSVTFQAPTDAERVANACTVR